MEKELQNEKDIIKDIQDSVDAILDRLDDLEDKLSSMEKKMDLHLETTITAIEKHTNKD